MNEKTRAVLFQVDAGKGVGLGHLQRCMALADALARQGVESVFIIDEQAEARVTNGGFRVVSHEERDAATVAGARNCQVIVVDSYRISSGYLAELRHRGLTVVAIDDLAEWPFAAHLVVNGGTTARDLPYISSTGDTQFLLGPEYAMLHASFWDAPVRPVSKDVALVLLTVGGSDPRDLLPRFVSWVDESEHPFELAVVLGPFAENRARVVAAVSACRRRATIVDSPESLRPVMEGADLAVCAAGQTLYELARLGVPTVAVEAFDNQVPGLRGFVTAGAVVRAGNIADDALDNEIKSAVDHLCADTRARASLSASGRQLIDGGGAVRVAGALLAA
jgi:UDP-2,4-diacetamido-2,4,6-trideoxy-beta-L-altropyranose hydrolase